MNDKGWEDTDRLKRRAECVSDLEGRNTARGNERALFRLPRDAKTPRVGGLADTSLSSNKLLTDTDVLNHPGGESIVANISDTYFVAQAVVTNSTNADLWFRYSDANTSYTMAIRRGRFIYSGPGSWACPIVLPSVRCHRMSPMG